MYVYDDGTVIWGAPGLHHYNDGAVPVVDENDPDKVKVRKTELMRRYDLAGRLMDLYEECGGEQESENSTIRFTDIEESECKEDIEKCAEMGIINGVSETEFSPNGVLTCEQLAVILDRLMKKLGNEIDFSVIEREYTDIDKVSSWAKDSIGIIESCFNVINNRLAPDEYVTVEEFEEIIENIKNHYITD